MMASPSLLRSATSSFHGQSPLFSAQLSVRIPPRSHKIGLVSVKAATGTVLVEKAESEKVNRLKATYLDKIIPKLKEEFSYKNILEVRIFFLFYSTNAAMGLQYLWFNFLYFYNFVLLVG